MGYFYDAADDGPMRLELRSVDGRDFSMVRRIGYRSDAYSEPFEVPRDFDTFRTDLASVPSVFTWLVPRSGEFLPAAVLHDSIVGDTNYVGPVVDRPEGDRIFRVAMREVGTGRIRAWMMWAAVTIPTMWHAMLPRLRWRAALLGLIGAISILGLVATADLVDLWNVLPWMGDRPWWLEVILGMGGAVVIPAILALSWGRFWKAGVIIGCSLGLLIHVTIAVALISGAYWIVERIVSGPSSARGRIN